MKILVTGATGFIGRHIVRWLINNTNHEIIATGTSLDKAKQFDWFTKVTFIPCDYFKEMHDYYEFFNKPDILIHAAWNGVHNFMDSVQMDNLFASLNLISPFISHNATKIVCIGSDKEYGKVEGLLSETDLTNPNTLYGLAKDTLRRNLEIQAQQKGFSWNWIRVFFAYGEGQRAESLLPMLERAVSRGDAEFPMTKGEQLRDYIHADTAAEYICKIALSSTNGIFNCCTGKPISVRRLVENRIAELGSDIKMNCGAIPYSKVEGMAFWGSTSKLEKILDEWRK